MFYRRSAILSAAAGLLMPAAARAASPEDDVRTAYAAWDAAFNKGDPKALADFYTEDAIFLPPSHEIIQRPAGIEKFFATLFASGVTGHKLELAQANATDEIIVAAARWSAKAKGSPVGGFATHEFTKQPNGALRIRLHTFN